MIIATITQKGGTGKTATSLALASYWQKKNKSVLLIDLDPQQNSTLALGIDNPKTTIEDLFKGNDCIIKTPFGIDVIAGSNKAHLTHKISPTALKNKFLDYDVVIIDNPPALNEITLAAIVAADVVLIPLLLDTFSLQGLTELQKNLNDIKALNPNFKTMAFFNRVAKNTLSKQLKPLFAKFCDDNSIFLLKATIRQSIAISEAAAVNRPLFDYCKRLSNATADFTELGKELEKRSK